MGTPLALTNGSLLLITPLSGGSSLILTPYAARGLSQTLEIIQGTGGRGGERWLRRDVHGILRDTSDIRFRKYRSLISCRDGETPCIDDAWQGMEVQVECACELNYPTGGVPARPVVAGSQRTQAGFTFYRPDLLMRIESVRNTFQEYAAINAWEAALEEV